jgi:hypothetical protein
MRADAHCLWKSSAWHTYTLSSDKLQDRQVSNSGRRQLRRSVIKGGQAFGSDYWSFLPKPSVWVWLLVQAKRLSPSTSFCSAIRCSMKVLGKCTIRRLIKIFSKRDYLFSLTLSLSFWFTYGWLSPVSSRSAKQPGWRSPPIVSNETIQHVSPGQFLHLCRLLQTSSDLFRPLWHVSPEQS